MLTILLALQALTPDPAAGPDVTVTAPRIPPAEVVRLTKAYVDSVLPTPVEGQFFRWHDPVCIKYTGLDPAYGPRITGRIARIAETAGVAVDETGCQANVLIVFTPDARKTVDIIASRQPQSLRHLSSSERMELRQGALPVRWWYGIDTASKRVRPKPPGDDKPVAKTSLPTNTGNVSADAFNQPSLISSNITVAVTGAVIVVDVTRAEGTSLDALADYVAMVMLVPTRIPPQAPGVPSILNLFASRPTEARPDTLSSWDQSLLTSLYEARVNRDARTQRREIVRKIKDDKTP